MKIKREIEEDLIVTWTDSNGVEHARDATPADLERAGWVKRDRYDNAQERVDQFAAEIGQLRDRAALAEQPDPGTLAHLRADLRDAMSERDELRHHYDAAGPEHNLLALLDSYESDADTARAEASAAYAMVVAAIGSVGAETIEAAVARLVADRGALLARAEKAELELADAESRAAHMLAVIRERDEAKAEAQSQREDGARLRDMLATLRAELERLTAPGEPTDEELERIFFDGVSRSTNHIPLVEQRAAGLRAVAARVRGEARATIYRQREVITAASNVILTTGTVAQASAGRGLLATLPPKDAP